MVLRATHGLPRLINAALKKSSKERRGIFHAQGLARSDGILFRASILPIARGCDAISMVSPRHISMTLCAVTLMRRFMNYCAAAGRRPCILAAIRCRIIVTKPRRDAPPRRHAFRHWSLRNEDMRLYFQLSHDLPRFYGKPPRRRTPIFIFLSICSRHFATR